MTPVYSVIYSHIFRDCLDQGLTTQEARIYAASEMTRLIKAYDAKIAERREAARIPVTYTPSLDLADVVKPVAEQRIAQIVEDEDGWWRHGG